MAQIRVKRVGSLPTTPLLLPGELSLAADYLYYGRWNTGGDGIALSPTKIAVADTSNNIFTNVNTFKNSNDAINAIEFQDASGTTRYYLKAGRLKTNLTSFNSEDLITRAYADGLVQGLDIKNSVKIRYTSAGASGTTGTLLKITAPGVAGVSITIDGVILYQTSTDRILMDYNGSTGALYNGIWQLDSVIDIGGGVIQGQFSRTQDAATGISLVSAFVFIEDGSYSDTGWVCTNTSITEWTTNIVWSQFSGAGTYSAHNGITLTGSSFGLSPISQYTIMGNSTTNASAVPTGLSTSAVRTMLAINNVENTALSTWGGSTNITTVGTIGNGTWNATAIGATKGGTGQTAVVIGDILYGSASNTWSRLGIGTAGQVLKVANGTVAWATDNNDNWYPTAFAWTNGTTNGPTGSLTGTGMSAVSFGSIPAASNTVSGVVTVADQIFKGAKTIVNDTNQDGVKLSGRAGGTSGHTVNLTPTTLTASVTVTLPNTGGTLNVGNTTTSSDKIFLSTSTAGLGVWSTTSIGTMAYQPNTGTTSITTLGTIGTGTWAASVISSTYGGTGVNNGGRTLTINTNSGTITFGAASKTLTINESITLTALTNGDILYASSTNTVGSTGSVPVTKGGTGLTVLGTANQILRVNAGTTALEYFTPTWTANTITLNGSVNANPTFYAPTTTATTGWFLRSVVDGAPLWGALTANEVTTALGFTPYSNTNPSGFTANTITMNGAANANPTFFAPTTSATTGWFLRSVAGNNAPLWGALTANEITTALGYTPYSSTNPSGYTTSSGVTSVSAGTGMNFTSITTSGSVTLRDIATGSTFVGAIAYNGTTKASGKFYGDSSTTSNLPSNTDILKFDGNLYATRFEGIIDGGAWA